MTKEQYVALKKKYMILDDVVSIMEFVSDLFYYEAQDTRANEPYATKTIERYEMVSAETYSMINTIDELEENYNG